MTPQNRLATFALACARIGLPVFPLLPGEKRPATKHGFKDATSDIATLESWWMQNPNFNVAIQTGIELDGRLLVVVDIDSRNGGYATKANLEASNGRLPDTVRVITGGGGEHLYFVCRPDVTLKAKLGPGIDIKWRGGYVVTPPRSLGGRGFPSFK